MSATTTTYIGVERFPEVEIATDVRVRKSSAEPGNPLARDEQVELLSDDRISVLIISADRHKPKLETWDSMRIPNRDVSIDYYLESAILIRHNGRWAYQCEYVLEV